MKIQNMRSRGCWISDYMDCNYLIILNKQFMIYFI